MPPRATQMTEEDLASIIEDQITDSVAYDRDEIASQRVKALRYFEGHETLDGDVPIQPKRSRVVSRDMSDVHGWIMSGLLRVFLGSDRVVTYGPRRREKEEGATQATDYINYLFLSECSGYVVLHSGIWDGVSVGNGIIKHWWDSTPEYEMERLSGIPEAEYIDLVVDPEVEVLEHTERDDPEGNTGLPHPAVAAPGAGSGGQNIPPALGNGAGGDAGSLAASQALPAPGGDQGGIGGGAIPENPGGYSGAPKLHDLKIKRRTSSGCLKIVAVPHEEFRIDRNATALDEDHVRFCAHISLRTRSSLIESQYDRAIVEDLVAHVSSATDTAESHARGQTRNLPDNAPDKSTELIEVWECYVQVDYDGDGVAEWRQVVTAAGPDARSILANEEWGDNLPFSDLVPDPMPHRWRGGSLFEEVGDIQRGKTMLWRGIMDNMRWINNPQRYVPESGIAPQSLGEFYNPTFGGTVFVKPNTVITELPIPFIADKLMAGMDLLDKIREFRTGVSASTMSLDPEALQNQTATGVNAMKTAGYTKIEAYARNIAEHGGLKRLFKCILKLVVQHQDKPRMIRLRGKWVEMDPKGWDADMDVIINVGLGSGSRDRDLAMLQAVAAKQETVVQGLGPMVAAQIGMGPDVIFATYRQMVESAGLKSPESYFPELTRDDVIKLIQQMQQAQQQQPNPQMAESQARIQLIGAQTEEVKARAAAASVKTQGDTAKTQTDVQKGMYGLEHIRAQIENLRASAAANMAKAGAIQSDAEINAQLAALDHLDTVVSWHQDQQKINHDHQHQQAQQTQQHQQQLMRQKVQTPGVRE